MPTMKAQFCPLRAKFQSSHETVDDEVEHQTCISSLMSQRVDHLRHA